jgi:hypothetical protein
VPPPDKGRYKLETVAHGSGGKTYAAFVDTLKMREEMWISRSLPIERGSLAAYDHEKDRSIKHRWRTFGDSEVEKKARTQRNPSQQMAKVKVAKMHSAWDRERARLLGEAYHNTVRVAEVKGGGKSKLASSRPSSALSSRALSQLSTRIPSRPTSALASSGQMRHMTPDLISKPAAKPPFGGGPGKKPKRNTASRDESPNQLKTLQTTWAQQVSHNSDTGAHVCVISVFFYCSVG